MSAAINAGFSLGFFLLVFGLPVRPFRLGAPDYLAFDFVPQSIMVALMSALVPALIERHKLAAMTGDAPSTLGRIVLRAAVVAFAALSLGACLATIGVMVPEAVVNGWLAFTIKLAYGAALGALVTAATLRQRSVSAN